MANGQLAASELSRTINRSGGAYKTYLRHNAAAGMNSLAMYINHVYHQWITPNGPNSDYRTLAVQYYFKRIYGSNAATPGTSNHGEGKARDGNGVLQWVYRSLRSTMRSAGWGKYEAFWENWHFNSYMDFEHPNPGVDPEFPVARIGSGGKLQSWYVKDVQYLLRGAGYGVAKDGQFGSTTERAVKKFQKNAGFKHPTGVVGPTTWKLLRNKSVRARHRRLSPSHRSF